MSILHGSIRGSLGAMLLLALSASCGDGGYRDKVIGSVQVTPEPVDASTPSDGAPPTPPSTACLPALASELLPPRASVLSRRKQAAAGMFTRDLFSLFQSHCGACHVDQPLGDFRVSLQTFPQKVTRDVLARIRSNAEDEFMPPRASGGKPYDERAASDPVAELAALLDAWLSAGSPADVFYPPSAGNVGTEAPFALSFDVGMAMTNLGNCIPAAQMVHSEQEKSSALDALFEQATSLPERLEDTDLFSLDSEVLARHGVLAFAPAYTLWADSAKKLRMLRVPRGTSIKFDAQLQSFEIPPNTRIYKTFFKRVVDYRGNESFRKMETRVIVSRPDVEQPDGSFQPGALFGTYVWNEAESEAVLVRDPLRNGKPFRDRLVNYITDEQQADAILSEGPQNVQEELEQRGVLRTYAVPGSARCVHCHMGAPNKSFVLGLTPLQLHRRPMSEGGVIEPAERDELNQLQRLIDYGVITGMSSPQDVVLLEDSQGERKPRNEHELNAQGYMLGNCAHCHNPRGFPSVSAPELRDLLDFWPSEQGGIFQFPLDRLSPRVKRGDAGSVPMPYLSPSLYDVPADITDPRSKVIGITDCVPSETENCVDYLFAPWRSLLYRNVDAPFAYAEDSVIFPHMPMDTPGYDCRARQFLGTWMVSIPSRWKYELSGTPEWLVSSLPEVATDPQPYYEVLPGERLYSRKRGQAEQRVNEFRESSRYNDCPDPSLNVVDPKVVAGERIVPGSSQLWPVRDSSGAPVLLPDGQTAGFYSLAAPERAHWADTDLTEAPGDWYPRRPDWEAILVADKDQLPVVKPGEARVIELLQTIRVTEELKALALEQVPFGFWKQKDGCDFSSQPKAADFTGDARPRWLSRDKFIQGTEPIYLTSPGANVFNAICVNCHGPQADSQSRLATTIADLTGGQTRVANLRDGLFGPPGSPGENITRVFGQVAQADLSAQDWAARYVLWMGLGGTGRVIPPTALTQIGNAPVMGQARKGYSPPAEDANMLTVARDLCAEVFQRNGWYFDPKTQEVDSDQSRLLFSNGDAEMWTRLCTFNNPQHVTVVRYADNGKFQAQAGGEVHSREQYPKDALVGDPSRAGFTTGIQAGNTAPWCLATPTVNDPSDYAAEIREYWSTTFGASSEIPFCPPGLQSMKVIDELGQRWITRGALNAGLAVFLYLEEITRGQKQPPIAFDQCEKLQNSP